MMIERRESLRYYCCHDIILWLPDGMMLNAMACNMSLTGLQVHAAYPLPQSTVLNAHISLIDPRTQQREQIRLRLVVKYCVHDSQTLDFRSGLEIEQFEGDGEALFMAVLEAQTQLWEGEPYESEPREPLNPPSSYHWVRRVRLYPDLQSPPLSVWTQRISEQMVIVTVDKLLALNQVCYLAMPIILPDSNTQQVIKIAAEVSSVVLIGSGQYNTTLRFLSFADDGQTWLNQEIRQRFESAMPY